MLTVPLYTKFLLKSGVFNTEHRLTISMGPPAGTVWEQSRQAAARKQFGPYI